MAELLAYLQPKSYHLTVSVSCPVGLCYSDVTMFPDVRNLFGAVCTVCYHNQGE